MDKKKLALIFAGVGGTALTVGAHAFFNSSGEMEVSSRFLRAAAHTALTGIGAGGLMFVVAGLLPTIFMDPDASSMKKRAAIIAALTLALVGGRMGYVFGEINCWPEEPLVSQNTPSMGAE